MEALVEEPFLALLDAFDHFSRAQPWQVLGSQQLFGVVHPSSGELGWCSVLGAGGLERGLQVYRGAWGLSNFVTVTTAEDEDEALQERFLFDCLFCSCAGPEELDSTDRALLAQAGHTYRGRGSWPLMRSFHPFCAPQRLHSEEMVMLTTCLRMCVEAMDLVQSRAGQQALQQGFPVFEHGVAEGWRVSFRLAEVQKPLIVPFEPDEVSLGALRRRGGGMHVVQVHCAFLPHAVHDRSPPWYPFMVMVVDKATGFILNHGIVEPFGDRYGRACERLVEALLELEHLPGTIEVRDERLHQALQLLCCRADIALQLRDELDMLDTALRQLSGLLSQER